MGTQSGGGGFGGPSAGWQDAISMGYNPGINTQGGTAGVGQMAGGGMIGNSEMGQTGMFSPTGGGGSLVIPGSNAAGEIGGAFGSSMNFPGGGTINPMGGIGGQGGGMGGNAFYGPLFPATGGVPTSVLGSSNPPTGTNPPQNSAFQNILQEMQRTFGSMPPNPNTLQQIADLFGNGVGGGIGKQNTVTPRPVPPQAPNLRGHLQTYGPQTPPGPQIAQGRQFGRPQPGSGGGKGMGPQPQTLGPAPIDRIPK